MGLADGVLDRGSINTADGVRVDADVLLEYETALTKAWHELLREA